MITRTYSSVIIWVDWEACTLNLYLRSGCQAYSPPHWRLDILDDHPQPPRVGTVLNQINCQFPLLFCSGDASRVPPLAMSMSALLPLNSSNSPIL